MGVKKTLRPIYAKYMTKFTKVINLLITGHKLSCRASIGKSSFNVSKVEDNRLSLSSSVSGDITISVTWLLYYPVYFRSL